MTVVTNYSPERHRGGGKAGVLWQLVHLWTFIEMKNSLLPKQKCFNVACPQQTATAVGHRSLSLGRPVLYYGQVCCISFGVFCNIINPSLSDKCKSNENAECVVEKRLVIMMQIKEISKLNAVWKVTSVACGWEMHCWSRGVILKDKERFKTCEKCWPGLCNGQQSARNKEK